jgi:hypothetical protein
VQGDQRRKGALAIQAGEPAQVGDVRDRDEPAGLARGELLSHFPGHVFFGVAEPPGALGDA